MSYLPRIVAVQGLYLVMSLEIKQPVRGLYPALGVRRIGLHEPRVHVETKDGVLMSPGRLLLATIYNDVIHGNKLPEVREILVPGHNPPPMHPSPHADASAYIAPRIEWAMTHEVGCARGLELKVPLANLCRHFVEEFVLIGTALRNLFVGYVDIIMSCGQILPTLLVRRSQGLAEMLVSDMGNVAMHLNGYGISLAIPEKRCFASCFPGNGEVVTANKPT